MVVTTTGFSTLARHTGKSAGIEDLRIAEYLGPLGIHDSARIEQNIESTLIDRIIDGLTQAAEDSAGTTRGRVDPRAIVCAGTADEINRYFIEQEWGDGLPIVPPTLAKVEQFLRYSGRAADETVAILQSANLRATPLNIAVNAVMAGCGPRHMPLLIAAVEALGDERCSLNNIGSSSGIFPFVLINGPLAKQLGIESGAQAISRGASYMGTFGYPLAFALAEHEDSPWEPFHVEQGFDRNANTVTIGVTNNWGAAPAPYDTPERGGAQVALELISREIIGKTRLFNFPGRGPDAEAVMITLLLSPPVAKSLAQAGYSKQDVKRHVYEHTRMRLADFDWVVRYTNIIPTTARKRAEEGVFPPEFLGNPDDRVRVLSSPDILHIMVCGDPHRNRLMVLEGGHTQPTTREITLAGPTQA